MNIKKIKAYLEKQEIIRVYCADATGFGVQKAALDILEYLSTELNFPRKIELIYLDNATEKLNILLQTDQISASEVYIQNERVSFISRTFFEQHASEFETVNLCFGEVTPPFPIKSAISIDFNLGITKTDIKFKLAEKKSYKVEYAHVVAAQTVLPNLASAKTALQKLQVQPQEIKQDETSFFQPELLKNQIDCSNCSTTIKSEGLSFLLEQKNTMAVYGLNDVWRFNRARIFSTFVQAIKQVQGLTAKEPTYILVFNNFSLSTQQNIIQATEKHQAKCFHISDPAFLQAQKELDSNDILIVFIGSTPSAIFDLFFTKDTIYPPVLEGKSVQVLMAKAEKPFIPTKDSFTSKSINKVLPLEPKGLRPAADYLDKIYQVLFSRDVSDVSDVNIDEAVNTIVNYITALTDKNSAISQFWRAFFDEYNSDLNNAFYIGLSEAMQKLGVESLNERTDFSNPSAEESDAIQFTKKYYKAFGFFLENQILQHVLKHLRLWH